MNSLDQQSRPAFFAWPDDGEGELKISVVVPMYNEAAGAATLIDEIAASLSGFNHEIIIVDDGSTDGTKSAARAVSVENLRVIAHQNNAGQSRAIRTGVLAARSPLIVTLDGDGQNDPADIPELISALKEAPDNVAMIAGERRKRQDSGAKKWASAMANGIRRRLLQDNAIDTGCGLKVFYREAFLRLAYFDHLHRYLPALMQREKFMVQFVAVSHRPRVHGTSKYTNFGRFLVAIRDLMGVLWLRARSRSPGVIEEVTE